MKRSKLTLFSLVAIVAIVVGVAVNKFVRQDKPPVVSSLDKEWMQQQGIVLFDTPRRFHTIGLETTKGKPFTVDSLKGHWTLLYFGFIFCPDICPTTLARLSHLDKSLKTYDSNMAKRVRYVMVSVDSERDSISKLKKYLTFFDKDFLGVRGEEKYMDALARQLNVVYSKVDKAGKGDYQMEHSAQVIIINPQGDFQGYIRPDFDVDKLLPAFRTMNQVLGNAVVADAGSGA